MEKTSKDVIIFGGAGFVGTRLANRLKSNGTTFEIFDQQRSQTHDQESLIGDITKQADLDNASSAQAIINLAAVHRDDVRPLSLYTDVNVEGSRKICEFAEKRGINKIIFTSSVAIYGFAPPNTDETGQANPFNEYGKTKFQAEQIYREWQSRDPQNRSLVIARPTVVFGEGNRGNVYNLLRQIASGKFIMFGNGKNQKSMAYVENVAAFLEHCLNFGPGVHLYNYIDKPDYSMNQLITEIRSTLFNKPGVGPRLPGFLGVMIGYAADAVSAVTRKNLPVSSIRVKKFMGTTQFDTSAAKTGFEPPVKLSEGLARTLRYEFLEDNSDKQVFETE